MSNATKGNKGNKATTTQTSNKPQTTAPVAPTEQQTPIVQPITTNMEVTQPIIPTTPNFVQPQMIPTIQQPQQNFVQPMQTAMPTMQRPSFNLSGSLSAVDFGIRPEMPTTRGKVAGTTGRQVEMLKKMVEISNHPALQDRNTPTQGWFVIGEWDSAQGATVMRSNLIKKHNNVSQHFELRASVSGEKRSKLFARWSPKQEQQMQQPQQLVATGS
jgi:hypothetical protein